MSDASDEVMGITRYFDAGDNYQLALLPSELYTFALHAEYLFIKKPAGCLECGYTSFAIKQMTKQRILCPYGRQKIFGGAGRVAVQDHFWNAMSNLQSLRPGPGQARARARPGQANICVCKWAFVVILKLAVSKSIP